MIDESAKPTVLLTGASGFLGSEILRLCQLANRSLRTIGRQPLANADHFQCDLTADALPEELFDGVQTIIHAAGLAHQFGKAGDCAEAFNAVNELATDKLIRAAARHGVQHFVLISSSGVYGPTAVFPNESANCNPVGPYATSKLRGEQAAVRGAETTAIKLTILRMTTLYGEGDRGNVDRLMKAIGKGRFVSVGRGTNKKNLIHKTDAARACLLSADSYPVDSVQIFNVATEPVAMAEVVDNLSKSLNCRRPLCLSESLVMPIANVLSACCFGRGPIARVRNTLRKWLTDDTFDGRRFLERFNFEPTTSLSEGLARQVKHFQDRTPPRLNNSLVKRAFDIACALALLVPFAIPLLVITALVKLTSKGPVLYWSDRVGQGNKLFRMAKFRSMRTDAPEVATHLLTDSRSWITPVGRILRKTSLDELPQLLNILKGDMSFVGPRPALHNQTRLVELRTSLGIQSLKPGITGWAAINGRDELRTEEKVEFDRQYLERHSFWFDIRIMVRTFLAVVKRDGVRQADDGQECPLVVIQQPLNGKVFVCSPCCLIPVSNNARRVGERDAGLISGRDDPAKHLNQLQQLVANASRVVLVNRSDSDSHGFDVDAITRAVGNKSRSVEVVELDLTDFEPRPVVTRNNASNALA